MNHKQTWDSCCSEKVKKKLVKLRAVYNYRVDSIRDEQIGSYSANCTVFPSVLFQCSCPPPLSTRILSFPFE